MIRASVILSSTLLLAACGERTPPETTASTPAPATPAAPPATPPWFEEQAAERGIDFVHRSGHDGSNYRMPEIMGGGAALFDMDGDGDLDAYVIQSGSLVTPRADRPSNRLYRNIGNGTFEDVTEASGADDRGYGMGVACGDADGDGDIDLYVTNVGRNVLLRNDGEGRFTDVTAAAGVGDEAWGTSAAFFDADADGDLDIFVTNYLAWSFENEIRCRSVSGIPDYCSPKSYEASSHDILYRNNGDGTFTDVSMEAGLLTAFGNGLGVVCGDFSGDGRLDVFVANDGNPNQLWVNVGDGMFTDAAVVWGCAMDTDGKAKAGMGVAAADLDDDLDLDLLVVNLRHESDSLYLNEGSWFSDGTIHVGLGRISRPYTRFGTGFHDFDNDGYLDLFEANGRVQLGGDDRACAPYAEPDLLLRGCPGLRFDVVEPMGGTVDDLVATSRAAAFGDVDGDGRVDVLVVNRDHPVWLLMNVYEHVDNWIGFRVVDEAGRDVLNARVTMSFGGRLIVRETRAASSYLASSDPRVHVGLGDATAVNDVVVHWPDGTQTAFGERTAGRMHVLGR